MTRKEVDPRILTTQRMSLDELERLRHQSRASAPLPGWSALAGLLRASLDDDVARDLRLRETRGADSSVTAASTALGIELVASKSRRVEIVRLHSQGHDGFHAWPGELGGILFSSTGADLKKLLGPPRRSQLGADSWDKDGHVVHVVYGNSGVAMVALCVPERAP